MLDLWTDGNTVVVGRQFGFVSIVGVIVYKGSADGIITY